MRSPDGHEGDAGTARRALVIDLDEHCWAMTPRDPLGQSSHWLNLESGELLFLAEPETLDQMAGTPVTALALSHAPATRHLRRRPQPGSTFRVAFRPRSRRSGALSR